MLTLNLPLPPSVNQAYGNRRGGKGRGRYKTKAYKDWVKNADAHYTLQRLGASVPIRGTYHVTIYMPEDLRGDEDNRVKPVLDWMVSRQLTPDDKHLRGHEVKRCPDVPKDMLWIVVREHEVLAPGAD
jgi:Holliday junction resolvase RusA-like endonuclease